MGTSDFVLNGADFQLMAILLVSIAQNWANPLNMKESGF